MGRGRGHAPAGVEDARMMDEITSQPATVLTHLIRERELSPVQVVEAYLHRIDQLNPHFNAIVTLAPDVMEKAAAAEAAVMRGETLGPLHGLPFTVKDTIETAGLRSTSGSPVRANFIPEHDAPAVSRLLAAGAILLGKTNTAEMAMDYNTDNPVFGRATNPYDHLRTTGGSSGGEAVAIATCMSPGGLGSDLAGSVRIPAHFCGISGLKPTVGQVACGGQFPAAEGPYALGSAIGPMARNVPDLQLFFNVLAGNQPSRPSTAVSSASLIPVMNGRRVAWYSNDGVSPVTSETRQAMETAARMLSEAGLKVEEIRPPGIERGHDLWLKLFSRASVVQLRNVYTGREAEAGAFVRWRLATADDTPAPTLDDYILSWCERDRLRSDLIEWMESTPLLLAPVGATPAFPHDSLKVNVDGQSISTFRAFSYSQTFNVFDLPAAAIPVSRSAEGLPIGVQIIGRPFEEETVLAAAGIIERALGQWQAPPLQ